jgi:hypothetical protein
MVPHLLTPRGAFHRTENPIAARLPSLNQRVLGLVDNSKPNADLFLHYIQELIGNTYIISEILKIRKPMPSVPAPFTQEFFAKCDFVINAFGD